MTLSVEPIKPANIIARVKGILLTPGAEWDRIAGETTSTNDLFMGYAVVLAAIGPLCGAVGSIAFGYGNILGVAIRPPIISVLVGAVVSYILSLVSVFILGLIIEALAPQFGGEKDRSQAMKVAVYGSTASWLAGVFRIMPALAALAIVGLYSLYLIYLGLPKLMKAPQDKALAYTGVVILVAIVLAIVVGAVMVPIGMIGGLAGAGLAS